MWTDPNSERMQTRITLFLPVQTCIMVKVIGMGVELLLMDPWGPIHPEATTSVTLNRSDWPELSSYTCRISVSRVLTAPSIFIFFPLSLKNHPFGTWKTSLEVLSLCPCWIIASSITQSFYLDFYLVGWPQGEKKIVKVPQKRRVMDVNFWAKYIDICSFFDTTWKEERSLLINSLIRYHNWHPTGLLLSVD